MKRTPCLLCGFVLPIVEAGMCADCATPDYSDKLYMRPPDPWLDAVDFAHAKDRHGWWCDWVPARNRRRRAPRTNPPAP